MVMAGGEAMAAVGLGGDGTWCRWHEGGWWGDDDGWHGGQKLKMISRGQLVE